jgi:transcriptional regulator with XRE-family HTH domain
MPPARSKLFSAALDSIMQERGVNQVQLAQRAGLAVSRLNNYLQGKYRTITPAHLGIERKLRPRQETM